MFIHLLGIYLGLQLQQVFGRFLDLLGTELYFDRGPPAVVETDDGIRFQAARITIVEDLPIDGLCVDPQVPGAEGFKEGSEIFEILKQSGRGEPHHGCCDGRIHEMAFHGSHDHRLGA